MKRLRSTNTTKRRKIEQGSFFWSMHPKQMQEYLKPFALGKPPKHSKSSLRTMDRRRAKRLAKQRANLPPSPPRPRSILDCISAIPISPRMALNTENRSITFRTNYINEQTNKLFLDKSIPNELFVLLLQQKVLLEEWVQIERKCISAFRNLVRIWLQRRYGTRLLNTEDPATMAEPIKPVLVFDYASRGLYCFEVSTIQKNIESSLSYTDWLLPEPLPPKNPFTNVPFTIGQNVKILQDLRIYGRNSWVLESYRSCGMNEQLFRNLFQVPLKYRILEEKIRNLDPDFLELFDEFVEDEHDYHNIATVTNINVLKWAIRNETTHRLIQEWICAFRNNYGIEIMYGMDEEALPILMRRIHVQTKKLFTDSVYKQDMVELGLKRFGLQSTVRVQRRQRQPDPTPTRGDPLLTTQVLTALNAPIVIRTSTIPLETFPAPLNVFVPISPERLNRRIVNLLVDETHPQQEIPSQEGI